MTQRNLRQLPFEHRAQNRTNVARMASLVSELQFLCFLADSDIQLLTQHNRGQLTFEHRHKIAISGGADSSSPARAAAVRPSSAHSADWIISCTHAMHHARCPRIDWTADTSSVACCGLSAAEEWRKFYRLDHLMHACHACWSPAPTSACMEDCGTPICDRSKMHALGHGN